MKDGITASAFPDSEYDLRKIATQLFSHEVLQGEFDGPSRNVGISIIARIYTKREVIPLLPHPVSLPLSLYGMCLKTDEDSTHLVRPCRRNLYNAGRHSIE